MMAKIIDNLYKTELKELKMIMDFIERHYIFIDNLRYRGDFIDIINRYKELKDTLFNTINYQELKSEVLK